MTRSPYKLHGFFSCQVFTVEDSPKTLESVFSHALVGLCGQEMMLLGFQGVCVCVAGCWTHVHSMYHAILDIFY